MTEFTIGRSVNPRHWNQKRNQSDGTSRRDKELNKFLDVLSKSKAETKPKPLPHEQRSRLTPGEVQAINDMRANPHIPEDAKPPLPEGYE